MKLVTVCVSEKVWILFDCILPFRQLDLLFHGKPIYKTSLYKPFFRYKIITYSLCLIISGTYRSHIVMIYVRHILLVCLKKKEKKKEENEIKREYFFIHVVSPSCLILKHRFNTKHLFFFLFKLYKRYAHNPHLRLPFANYRDALNLQ